MDYKWTSSTFFAHSWIQLKFYFYILLNSPNHHERRSYTTEVVSQRIPKITIFQCQTSFISIQSIQVCPSKDVMPPGSFACGGTATGGRIVIYVTCTELVSICICGSMTFNRVPFSIRMNNKDINRDNIA